MRTVPLHEGLGHVILTESPASLTRRSDAATGLALIDVPGARAA